MNVKTDNVIKDSINKITVKDVRVSEEKNNESLMIIGEEENENLETYNNEVEHQNKVKSPSNEIKKSQKEESEKCKFLLFII